MNIPSFLAYVVADLLGEAEYGGNAWHCPWCDPQRESEWPSFTVRPPKQKSDGSWHPIKFRCHRCHVWGDELDLVGRLLEKTEVQAIAHLSKLVTAYKDRFNIPGLRAYIRRYPPPAEAGSRYPVGRV